MAQAHDNQAIFEHLAEAGKLYDRYLEISRIAQIPTPEEIQQTFVAHVQPSTNVPTTFEIRTQN